jgi:20S proteasome alpha/beta subunit
VGGTILTIAVAVQVHDGVVLASDSATTLTDPSKTGSESILNVYNNANKIFNGAVPDNPFGGLSWELCGRAVSAGTNRIV